MPKILLVGGSGYLGTALTKHYIQDNQVLIYSRSEERQWDLCNKVKSPNLQCIVGDVRDLARLKDTLVLYQPDYVIIASALKQISVCEESPIESVQTNVLGTQNVLDAISYARGHRQVSSLPKAVCFISSDKACAAINIYGSSKYISERLMLQQARHHSDCKYVVARYGNVLGSSGSVVPLFLEQATNPKVTSFTLTDSEMTRFVITLEQAIGLITNAIAAGSSSDIWVPQLESMRIHGLADYFSQKYNKPVTIIGSRPGEKVHELLLCKDEAYNQIGANYVVSSVGQKTGFDYSSKDYVMSYSKLSSLLDKYLDN